MKHSPPSTLPLAGRVAQLEAQPRSEAREGGARIPSLAQKLRAAPTASEVRMWRLLWGLRTNGYHFRKQVRLGTYYADFACHHAGLVIEVDGVTHESMRAQGNDAVRDDYLRGRGYTVLRFSSEDVMRRGQAVGDAILAALSERPPRHRGSAPPSPSLPARGRGPSGAKGNT